MQIKSKALSFKLGKKTGLTIETTCGQVYVDRRLLKELKSLIEQQLEKNEEEKK